MYPRTKEEWLFALLLVGVGVTLLGF